MESEEITKLVDGIYKNILDKFNPGARQLINAGKAYLKALHGAAAASRLYVEAITKLARQAQQGSTWGGSADVGSALMQIVEVYKEIQSQQMNILKAFYVDLLVPLETNLEKDTKVVQSEQKKFLQQHKQRHETYSKAAATMKKQRKKTKGGSTSSSAAKTGIALDKELKNMQILEEEKSKLDGFCEQSLKTAITQERRRYGFVLERQCSLAKHYLAYHNHGHALFQQHLDSWQEVARTREFLPEAVDTMFANRLSQVNFWQEDDEDDIYSQPSRGKSGSNVDADRLSLTSQLRKTKSMDASCLELRSMNEVAGAGENVPRNRGSTAGVPGMGLGGSRPTLLGSLSRAKSEFNLTASTHSLVHEPETPPVRPKSMAVPESQTGTGRRVRGATRSRTEEDLNNDGGGSSGQVARALYAYLSSGENQLSFLEGDLISLMGERNKGWQFGENLRTRRSGWFPLAYTEVVLTAGEGDEDIDDECLRSLEDDVDDDDEREGGGGEDDRTSGSPGQPNRPSRRRNRSQGTLPHQRHHHRMSSVDTAVIGVANGSSGKSIGLLSPTSGSSATNPAIASTNANRPSAPKPPPPPPIVSANPNSFGDTILQRVTGHDKIRLATTSTASEAGSGAPNPPIPPNYSHTHQTFQARGPVRTLSRPPHSMHPHVPPPPPPPPPPGHAPSAFSSLPPFTSFSSPFSASSTSSSSSSSSTTSSHSQRTPQTNTPFGKLRSNAAGTPVAVPVVPGTVGIGNASLHSSNDSGFSNEGLPPPQPEADYSDDDSPRDSAATHETPGNLSSVVRGWLLYKSALELWEDVNNQAMEDELKETNQKDMVAATLGRQGGGGALQQLHRRTSFSADHLLASQDGMNNEYENNKKGNGKTGSLVKRTLSFWKIRPTLSRKRNSNKDSKQITPSTFQEPEPKIAPEAQLWRHDSIVKLTELPIDDKLRKTRNGNETMKPQLKESKSQSSIASSAVTEGTVRHVRSDVESFSWIAVDGYMTQSKKLEIAHSAEKTIEERIPSNSKKDKYTNGIESDDSNKVHSNGNGREVAYKAIQHGRRKHPPLPPPPPPPLPSPPPLPKGHPTLDLKEKDNERKVKEGEVKEVRANIKGSLRIATSSKNTTQYLSIQRYGERIHSRLYKPERGSRFDQKSEASGNMCGPWYDLWGVDQSVVVGK